MSGIELLEKIKNNELENGTRIKVLCADAPWYYTHTIIDYIDGELNWEPRTFKASMLYNDDYFFEIIEDKSKKIEKIELLENYIVRCDKKFDSKFISRMLTNNNETDNKIKAKLNEVIDH